ncbi:MAG TPA: hypothetical protein VM755_09940 [Stellaceae bacterium]|nr:hypothetical protein [Stellaceae bacterium]
MPSGGVYLIAYLRTVADGFVQVLIAPPETSAVKAAESAGGGPAIEVEFAGKVRDITRSR